MMRRRSRRGAHQLMSPTLVADRRSPNIDGENIDGETDDAVGMETPWAEVDDELLLLDNDFVEISTLIDELKNKDAERAQLTHVNKHETESGEKERSSENQEPDVICWLSLERVFKDLQALCDEFVA